MRLYVANGTREGGEVQLRKAQLDALIQAMQGTRHVALMQKLSAASNRMATDRPIRLPLSTSEIATLRYVAEPITEE